MSDEQVEALAKELYKFWYDDQHYVFSLEEAFDLDRDTWRQVGRCGLNGKRS